MKKFAKNLSDSHFLLRVKFQEFRYWLAAVIRGGWGKLNLTVGFVETTLQLRDKYGTCGRVLSLRDSSHKVKDDNLMSPIESSASEP